MSDTIDRNDAQTITRDYPLLIDPPTGANPLVGYSVEISYDYVGSGSGRAREFRYRESPLLPFSPVLLVGGAFGEGLAQLVAGAAFSDALDLSVRQDCTI